MMQTSAKPDHQVDFDVPGRDLQTAASVEIAAPPRFYASIQQQKSDIKGSDVDALPPSQEQSSSLKEAKVRASETILFYRSVITTLEVHRISQSQRGTEWCLSKWTHINPDQELANQLREWIVHAKQRLNRIFRRVASGVHLLLRETAKRLPHATQKAQIASLMRKMELATEMLCHRRRESAQHILNKLRAAIMEHGERKRGKFFNGEGFNNLVQVCFCLDEAANYHPEGNRAWEARQTALSSQAVPEQSAAAAVPSTDQPAPIPLLYTEQLQHLSEIMPDYAWAWFHETQAWEIMEHPPTLAMQRTMLWRDRVQQSLGNQQEPQALSQLLALPTDIIAFPDTGVESSLSARSSYEVDRWMYAMVGLWAAHGAQAPCLWMDRDTSCNRYWA